MFLNYFLNLFQKLYFLNLLYRLLKYKVIYIYTMQFQVNRAQPDLQDHEEVKEQRDWQVLQALKAHQDLQAM